MSPPWAMALDFQDLAVVFVFECSRECVPNWPRGQICLSVAMTLSCPGSTVEVHSLPHGLGPGTSAEQLGNTFSGNRHSTERAFTRRPREGKVFTVWSSRRVPLHWAPWVRSVGAHRLLWFGAISLADGLMMRMTGGFLQQRCWLLFFMD